MLNSILNSFLIKNIKTGIPSYTLSASVYGFILVNFKLIFSGITIGTFHIVEFGGIEYASAIAALTTLYVSNKHINNLGTAMTIKQDNNK